MSRSAAESERGRAESSKSQEMSGVGVLPVGLGAAGIAGDDSSRPFDLGAHKFSKTKRPLADGSPVNPKPPDPVMAGRIGNQFWRTGAKFRRLL